jgi:hypothetical protein
MAPLLVVALIVLIYIGLGCVMESMSMIVLTVPIFYPMIMKFDLWGLSQDDKSVWFGILALMVVEIGLITPPVGLNAFVVNKLAGDVPLAATFRGIAPFLVDRPAARRRAVLLPLHHAVSRARAVTRSRRERDSCHDPPRRLRLSSQRPQGVALDRDDAADLLHSGRSAFSAISMSPRAPISASRCRRSPW